MDDQLLAELLESAHEALEHSKGQRNLKTVVLPRPPEATDADDGRRRDSSEGGRRRP